MSVRLTAGGAGLLFGFLLIGMALAGAFNSQKACVAGGDSCQMVLRHVVCFKFKDGATDESIQKVCADFASLKNEIRFIQDFEWGRNVSPENLNKGFTHCFILTFKNEMELEGYLNHPAHKAFGKNLGPVLDDVFVVDFETCAKCGGRSHLVMPGSEGSGTKR